MGIRQKTLRVSANKGRATLVLIAEKEVKEEGGESEPGLLTKCCRNSHTEEGVGTPRRRDRPLPRPGGRRRHSPLEELSEGSVPGAQGEWRQVTG